MDALFCPNLALPIVSIFIGKMIQKRFKNMRGRIQGTVWLYLTSAFVSVMTIALLGFAVGYPLYLELDASSSAHPESDTGTAFGMLFLFGIWAISLVLAFVTGSGIDQPTTDNR